MAIEVVKCDLIKAGSMMRDANGRRGYDRVFNRRIDAALRKDFESGRLPEIHFIPDFAVFFILKGGVGSVHELGIQAIAPSGRDAGELRTITDWQRFEECEGSLQLDDFIFTGIGTYEVRFSCDGESLKKFGLLMQWERDPAVQQGGA